jgi:hypothetical protein
MRRLLTVTMALGLVISAMSFTGIFAVFTDRASTGTNTAESGEQPRTADLLIGTTESTNCVGAVYSDDLATGIWDLSDLVPGPDYDSTMICLKNIGTAELTLTVTAIDVVETETGCTGDEAAAGDATCGTAGLGDGELGSVLITSLVQSNCLTGVNVSDSFSGSIQDLAGGANAVGTVAPGEVACIYTTWAMPEAGPFATSDELQQAQSDKVTWRYAFDGTAS